MALLFRAVPIVVVGYEAFGAHGQGALGLGMMAVTKRAWGPLAVDTRSLSEHRRVSRRSSRRLFPRRLSPMLEQADVEAISARIYSKAC